VSSFGEVRTGEGAAKVEHPRVYPDVYRGMPVARRRSRHAPNLPSEKLYFLKSRQEGKSKGVLSPLYGLTQVESARADKPVVAVTSVR